MTGRENRKRYRTGNLGKVWTGKGNRDIGHQFYVRVEQCPTFRPVVIPVAGSYVRLIGRQRFDSPLM